MAIEGDTRPRAISNAGRHYYFVGEFFFIVTYSAEMSSFLVTILSAWWAAFQEEFHSCCPVLLNATPSPILCWFPNQQLTVGIVEHAAKLSKKEQEGRLESADNGVDVGRGGHSHNDLHSFLGVTVVRAGEKEVGQSWWWCGCRDTCTEASNPIMSCEAF